MDEETKARYNKLREWIRKNPIKIITAKAPPMTPHAINEREPIIVDYLDILKPCKD
jgi:hypothetical protein